MTTRNAYDTLTRLTEDVEAEIRYVRTLVAAATPVLTMDQLTPGFEQMLDTWRAGCRELRADLDLLTVEATHG